MEGCKVSIIVPVYNTRAKYLKGCVESIINQSYKNFELIIVDDGSEKECFSLCDSLKNIDPRIIVIHQQNSGVSAARNNGTQNAGGDYIMYVDSDDVLANNAVHEGISAVKKTGAQFAFAGIQRILDHSELKKSNEKLLPEVFVYTQNEINIVRSSFLTQRNKEFSNINGIGAVNRGPYARLIRSDIAKEVKFNTELVIGEDVEWNMRILNACDTVCYVKNIWYGYLIYETSSLRKYYGNRAELLEKYHNALYNSNKEYCDKNIGDYAVNMSVSFYTLVLSDYLAKECPLTEKEKKREIKQVLNRFPWTILKEKHAVKKILPRYRVFLTACRLGFGLNLLRQWEVFKAWKK